MGNDIIYRVHNCVHIVNRIQRVKHLNRYKVISRKQSKISEVYTTFGISNGLERYVVSSTNLKSLARVRFISVK